MGTLFTANLPGDAALPAGSLNAGEVINIATNDRHSRLSGVARLPNGHYIISSARASQTSSAHKYFELAADGGYLGGYDQPSHTSVDGLGLRDLGWDGKDDADSRIWWGTDGSGIVSFDWHNMLFDPIGSFGPVGLKVLDGYQGNAIWCCAVADIDGQAVLVTADSPNPSPLAGTPFIGRPVNWHLIKFPADSRIWAGFAGKGINSFDWQTFTFDPSFNPANLQTGLKIMDGWQGAFVQCSAIADVGGQKIFVSADIFNPNPLVNPPTFGTPVNYHVLGSSTIDVFKFQEPTPDISDPDVTILGAGNSGKWGAAYDPLRGTIWWHVDLPTASANTNGSRTRFIEMDMSGNRTGQIFQGDRDLGGLGWGCEMYVDQNGELITVYLVGGSQGAPAGDAVLVEIKSRFQFGSR